MVPGRVLCAPVWSTSYPRASALATRPVSPSTPAHRPTPFCPSGYFSFLPDWFLLGD